MVVDQFLYRDLVQRELVQIGFFYVFGYVEDFCIVVFFGSLGEIFFCPMF